VTALSGQRDGMSDDYLAATRRGTSAANNERQSVSNG
jgi:hypothetical protein